MTKKEFYIIGLLLLTISACRKNDDDVEVEIPDFNFPQTISFETSLSAYGIFDGTPSDLLPSEGFELLELSSALCTDLELSNSQVPWHCYTNDLNRSR